VFVEVLANFHVNLNDKVLSAVERTHAIDGRHIFLLDARHIPGLGFQVNLGLTVWTTSVNYTWMSAVMLRFTELLQERKLAGPVVIHMECTELYSFTPFIQENGVPCIDGVNMISLASRATSAPMRFVTFKQDKTTNLPPTPAALIAATQSGKPAPFNPASFYRDIAFPMRSPTMCAHEYGTACDPLLHELRRRWGAASVAQPLDGKHRLVYGAKMHAVVLAGESLYVASAALDLEHGYFMPAKDGGSTPDVQKTILMALDKGYPLYYAGDANSTYEVFKETAEVICQSELKHTVRAALEGGLKQASSALMDASERAWVMRTALDEAYVADMDNGIEGATVQYAPRDDDDYDMVAFFGIETVNDSVNRDGVNRDDSVNRDRVRMRDRERMPMAYIGARSSYGAWL